MERVLVMIDPSMELYQGWTIQQILAHLSGWDALTIDLVKVYGQDIRLEMPSYKDFDDFNTRSIEKRKHQSYEQTLAEWRELREQLKAILRETPDERWSKSVV
jgi:hypothetical protein